MKMFLAKLYLETNSYYLFGDMNSQRAFKLDKRIATLNPFCGNIVAVSMRHHVWVSLFGDPFERAAARRKRDLLEMFDMPKSTAFEELFGEFFRRFRN